MPELSVILPVYNTRRYLPFTLRNIIECQLAVLPPGAWELIIVDDGSTDGSHLEAEPWMQKYPAAVKLIRKDNAGVSAARNTGLNAASGKYVYFADSDDIILQNSISQLLQLANNNDIDMMKFMCRQISSEEYERYTLETPVAPSLQENFQVHDVRSYLVATKGMLVPDIHTSTIQTIYRRSLLTDNDLRYNERLSVGEDEMFTWSAIAKAKRIGYTPAELYLYHQRSGSLSHARSRAGEKAYQFARVRFCGEIINTLGFIDKLLPEEISREVYRNYFMAFQHSIIDLTVKRYPLGLILKAMKLYRSYGGDVHPGRPRFSPYYDKHSMPLSIKIRRIIVAFILPLLA